MGGPTRFEDKRWYTDYAHLTEGGMRKLWDMMAGQLKFALAARNIPSVREEDERRAERKWVKRNAYWEKKNEMENKRVCRQSEGVVRVRGPVRQNIRELKEVVESEMRQGEDKVKIRDTWEERARWMDGEKGKGSGCKRKRSRR